MPENVTMANVSWGSRHRSCKVGKVENGYEVEAQFPQVKKDKYDPGAKALVFVFTTLSETIGWVNWYFTEDADKLAEEPSPLGPEG